MARYYSINDFVYSTGVIGIFTMRTSIKRYKSQLVSCSTTTKKCEQKNVHIQPSTYSTHTTDSSISISFEKIYIFIYNISDNRHLQWDLHRRIEVSTNFA